MSSRNLRKLGLCGLIAPPLAFTCIFLSVHLSPSFGWMENALSDLGVGKTAPLFNLGLMVTGLLLFIFSLSSLFVIRESSGQFASLLLGLDSLALFCIGLFPESYGDLHFWVSVLFFLLFPFVPLSFSLFFWKKGMKRGSLLSLFFSFLPGIPWVYRWRGLAIPETLSSCIASAYVMALSLLFYLGKPPYHSEGVEQ
ncbi:MAG: DUF998 domain-containing protein [Candidatus Hadarchaeales archaeon]